MDSSRRGRSIGFLCLVVTAFGWALNWPLMKLLLLQWPPLVVAAWQVGLGCFVDRKSGV